MERLHIEFSFPIKQSIFTQNYAAARLREPFRIEMSVILLIYFQVNDTFRSIIKSVKISQQKYMKGVFRIILKVLNILNLS